MSVHPRAAVETDAGFTTSGRPRNGHAIQVAPAHPALISVGALDATRPATSDTDRPTLVEVGEESILFVDMIVIGATIVPGVLLCAPALLLFIVPVVALGGLVAVAVGLAILLLTAPVRLGWWVAHRLRHNAAARHPGH
jgi:hypothetical protein